MNESILIVEDDDVVREMLCHYTESLGYTALGVTSAEQALEILERSRADLVIADLKLPGMDGLALARRSLEQDPNRPVLLMTAYADLDSARQAIGIGVSEYFIKPINPRLIMARMHRALEHRQSVLQNREYQKGLEREVEEHGSELQMLNERLQRVISERRQAEEVLRDREERLQSLVEHLPDGVCLLDAERRLVLANPAVRDALSALTDSGEGEAISDLGGCPIEDLLTSGAGGAPCEVVTEGPPKQIFEVAVSPIAEGRTDGGWVLAIGEVTQEREARERMHLQGRLAAVGQLAAGIAHDFNNMLTVIIGFAEIMEMRSDIPDYAKNYLETIVSQGQRAEQLIRQILDFSRRTSAKRQPMDLVPFLKEVVKLLERTLPRHIHMAAEFDGGPYILDANLVQLQEVVTNLAINARDAMPQGGEIRLGLSHMKLEPGERLQIRSSSSRIVPELEPGEWVVLTVSDSGTGIPPEIISRIYQPFFTTKQHGKGTGLGLAQVYGIVKQHGGYIDVESEVGKGTTFTLYLKRTAEEAVPVEKAEGGIRKGGGETVLVVENEEAVVQVIRAMLERLGYRVLPTSDGRKALEVYDAQAGDVALVLTEQVMPEMGGVELAAALRERNPALPIVMMTGRSAEEKEEASSPPQNVAYLEKPFKLQQMAQVVRQALNRATNR